MNILPETTDAKILKTLQDLYVITRKSALNHIVGETFIVNSSHREHPELSSDSKFQFRFPSLFNPSATRIVVLQASIPKTYYLVNGGKIRVIEGVRFFTVSMPAGNYNAISFRNMLAGLLTTASAAYGLSFVYSIPSGGALRTVDTGLMTIKVQGNGATQPIFETDDSTLHDQLGLSPKTTYHFTNNHFVSPFVCNFNLLSQLFIRSDICQNSQDNILQDIYTVGNVSNSFIVYESKAPMLYSKRLNNTGQTYHFWLTDSAGNQVDLHGIEMSFTVLVY